MGRIYEYNVVKGEEKEVFEESTMINCADDVYTFSLNRGWNQHEQEHLYSILLNSKNRIKGYSLITKGLIDRSHIHARETYRAAIIGGASRIVLVHNHPSGDPTPSSQDISTTRELVAAGNVVGIKITDHVILGSTDGTELYRPYYSLQDNGFIR